MAFFNSVLTNLILKPFPEIAGAVGDEAAADFYEPGAFSFGGPTGKGLAGNRNVVGYVLASNERVVVRGKW